jgi:hypothetical protein
MANQGRNKNENAKLIWTPEGKIRGIALADVIAMLDKCLRDLDNLYPEPPDEAQELLMRAVLLLQKRLPQ